MSFLYVLIMVEILIEKIKFKIKRDFKLFLTTYMRRKRSVY